MSTQTPTPVITPTHRAPTRLPLAAGAFVRKEALEVLRQPRLLITLVLGPFLILCAFGLSYQEQVRAFRTLFVGDPQSELAKRVEASASQLGSFVHFEGIEPNEAVARERLLKNDVDALVVLPNDPLQTVLQGQRAPIQVVHNRLDPIDVTVIKFATRLAVDQVNANVLSTIAAQGQQLGTPLPQLLSTAGTSLDSLLAATDSNAAATIDNVTAQTQGLLARASDVTDAVAELAGEVSGAHGEIGALARQLSAATTTAQAQIDAARTAASQGLTADAHNYLAQARAQLQGTPELAARLLSVDPQVLIQPFSGSVESVQPDEGSTVDYYAPAAIVLMLQQFGLAFASLSFVRERQLGIVEVYRVAPVGTGQVVAGKYIGHVLLSSILGAVLGALVIVGLGVPMHGSVVDLILVLALVSVASVGLGFLVSLTSRTELQAVLATMLILLASLFFSGFFLSVDQLAGPARIISYALPATYGNTLVRDVMLRGDPLDPTITLGLVAYALAMVAASIFLTHRFVRRKTATVVA